MCLRGVKPSKIEKRLKALFYGEAGVGKTYGAIHFPKPYLIDTERGAENDQYTALLEKQGGAIFQTSDFWEVLKEVKSLLTEDHTYKTLIIDPVTVIYDALVDESEAEILLNEPDKDPTAWGRHRTLANKKFKRLLNIIKRLDMNVVMTSHGKTKYSSSMDNIGQTYDAYKKLDYEFDLALEIREFGGEHTAIPSKSRIEGLPKGESFVFSYEHIEKQYGKEILRKQAVKEELASKKQINKITKLIELLKVPEEVVDKWTSKAQASSLEEMETSKIQACIDHLQSKIEEK